MGKSLGKNTHGISNCSRGPSTANNSLLANHTLNAYQLAVLPSIPCTLVRLALEWALHPLVFVFFLSLSFAPVLFLFPPLPLLARTFFFSFPWFNGCMRIALQVRPHVWSAVHCQAADYCARVLPRECTYVCESSHSYLQWNPLRSDARTSLTLRTLRPTF